MSFEVIPADVDAAGADLRVLGATVSGAYSLMLAHGSVGSGGSIYNAIVGELSAVADDIRGACAPRGPAESLFYGAGFALSSIAHDYTTIDQAQAERYDALLPDVGEVERPTSQWTPDDPGIDRESLLGILHTSPENDFSDYESWVSINDAVDRVIALDFLPSALNKIGIDFDPISAVQDEFGGDWAAMGRAIGALELVKEYWYEVSYEIEGVVARYAGSWSGRAADAATTWLSLLQEKAFSHAKSIGKSVDRIKAESLAFVEAVSALESALDDITGLIPDTSSLGGAVLDVLEDVLQGAITKIWSLIDLWWNAFGLAKAAGQSLVAVFAQLTRFYDTEWPAVPAYTAPDVDGPER